MVISFGLSDTLNLHSALRRRRRGPPLAGLVHFFLAMTWTSNDTTLFKIAPLILPTRDPRQPTLQFVEMARTLEQLVQDQDGPPTSQCFNSRRK